MIRSIKKHIIEFWPILAIVIIEGILFLANFKPDTWLIGWDNLYPELNSGLNIKRSLFGVWQEYRSLGYMDGMSHSANLFHDMFRWMLSLIMPTHMVRWVFVFLMHFLGGIGMYILLSHFVTKKPTSTIQPLTSNLLPLFGSLFYQYNLITVQQFFLPFELFIIHFAFLPWLIYLALSYFETAHIRTLVWFGVMSFLSVAQAHVPTIFIVYIMALSIIMIAQIVMKQKDAWKRALTLVVVTIMINAFWGIPFAYATLQNSHVIANSKNNQMGTDDIFYRNLKFGDFSDVAQMKGIVLDYWQYDIRSGASHFMMHPWLEHISTAWFYIPAWIFFLLIIVGCISIFVKKQKRLYPLAAVFIFGFVMMANDTPIVSWVSTLLREFVPLFHNVFRFTFTKFSIVYAFGATIFLFLGANFIFQKLKKGVRIMALLALLLLLVSYSFPSFQQNFFYENLAATIPQEYAETFEFFKSQDIDSRVAMLPIPNYWAWTQNDWNTIGSGFLWYGIPQPTTDRAFDPWSAHNENFYWELDQAIFSENVTKVETVFQKYDISWILVDSSVYQGASPKFDIDRYHALIDKSSQIHKVKTFGSIEIYSFDLKNPQKSFVSVLRDVPSVGPQYTYDSDDTAFEKIGTYINTDQNPQILFPYRTLFSGKNTEDEEFTTRETDDYIYFQAKLPENMKSSYLAFPTINSNEFIARKPHTYNSSYYDAVVMLDGQEIYRTSNLSDSAGSMILLQDFPDGILEVGIPKMQTLMYSTFSDYSLDTLTNTACYANPDGISDFNSSVDGLLFTSQASSNCINIDIPTLSQRVGYLFKIETENSSIKGLHLNVINQTSRKTDLETYFDNDGATREYSIVLPPRAYYGAGYTVNINNVSFGKEKVTNTLKSLSMYQMPYEFMKNITFSPSLGDPQTAQASNPLSVTHTADDRFIIDGVKNAPDSLLYLSQGFDPGWKAYETCSANRVTCKVQKIVPMFFGTELKDHVLVNNWANGWQLKDQVIKGSKDQNLSVVIIFWPQYLEFLGFGILIISLLTLPFWRKKRHK